jgi:hypothetical protein
MNSLAPSRPAPSVPSVDDTVLAGLCAGVFASMPRSDQRERAQHYVLGLLSAEGRKSFRNMAAHLGGGPTLEQRLHHFVSCSTWDWAPVRQALTELMVREAPPEAWVLRSLIVPKDGSESVGVHRRYAPALGRMLNLQYTVGLWSATATACHPLGWRLLLPRTWTDDPVLRARVSIPATSRTETPGECAVQTYLEMTAQAPDSCPLRPVVVAVDGVDVVGVIQQLRCAGVPFLVKSMRGVPLAVVGQDLVETGPRPSSTHQILAAARGQAPHVGSAITVRVRSPLRAARSAPHPAADDLLLLGVRDGTGDGSDGVWLTNMLDTCVSRLTALTALAGHTDDSLARITRPLGIRDFAGRTFGGWNRHATLVSVAHCAVQLSSASSTGVADVPSSVP